MGACGIGPDLWMHEPSRQVCNQRVRMRVCVHVSACVCVSVRVCVCVGGGGCFFNINFLVTDTCP